MLEARRGTHTVRRNLALLRRGVVQVSTGDGVAEIELAELGCMNEGDERGSEQKGLV